MDTHDNNKTLEAINDLAVMVGKGFEHVHQEMGELKDDVQQVKRSVTDLKQDQQNLFEIVKEFSPKAQQKLRETVDEHERRIRRLESKPT